MLGTKNRCNSGKYSLALPLQHCNFQFFDISEIGTAQRLVEQMGFCVVCGVRILVKDCRSGFQQCIVAGAAAQALKIESVILSRI